MFGRLFAIAMLLMVPLAAAAPPPAPSSLPIGVDRSVYGELTLAQPNLTSLVLMGDLYIYRYTVEGDVYDADELGSAYNGFNRYGKAIGNAFVADVEEEARAALERILGGSFANATLSGISATVDRTTLQGASGNPYDPPVRITVTAQVDRTKESVGLGTLSDAAIDAAFAAGAQVDADLALTADAGYRIAYTLGAPPGLVFSAAEGVAPDRASFTLLVDNSVGTQPARDATVTLARDGVQAPAAEDIRSSIDVTLGDPQKGAVGVPLRVAIDAKVHALDVGARFPGALPTKVSLPFVNADGIRALRSTGALKDADVARANEALLTQIRADLQRAFGGQPTVTGGLAQRDMTAQAVAQPYTDADPVTFSAASELTYVVPGADADDIDLAMRIGGTAVVDLKLFSANGRETAFAIHPPTIGVFTQAEGGSVSVDGRTATFRVPAGAREHAASISLRGSDAPTFTAEDSEIAITVDLKDLDVTTGKAMGGDLGNLLVELTVVGRLGVIEVPDDLQGSLPDNLELTHLSSDAIRLLIDSGHVTPANLTKLEQSLMETVAEKLGAALGGEIPVEGGFEDASLSIELVQTPISGDEPIVFKATARFLKPLAGGDIQPQAAIALYTTQLPLTLPRIEDRETAYTIIAPKGLALTGTTAGEISQAPDGRDQVTVRPQGDAERLTISMAVTPGFVLAKFWPIVLLAVVLLVLLVGTPVALVLRSRGKKKAQPPAKGK